MTDSLEPLNNIELESQKDKELKANITESKRKTALWRTLVVIQGMLFFSSYIFFRGHVQNEVFLVQLESGCLKDNYEQILLNQQISDTNPYYFDSKFSTIMLPSNKSEPQCNPLKLNI